MGKYALLPRREGAFPRTGSGTTNTKDYGLHTKLGGERVEFGSTGSAGPASGRSQAYRLSAA